MIMKNIINLLLESFSQESIGQTNHFLWFSTSIGIAALCKTNELSIELLFDKALKEGLEIAIDLRREEKEIYQTEKGLVLLFYS